MSLLELFQMPILTITSWLVVATLHELRRWSRAAGLGPVPERQPAAPAEPREVAAPFVAGHGARVYSLDAFRRARHASAPTHPRVA